MLNLIIQQSDPPSLDLPFFDCRLLMRCTRNGFPGPALIASSFCFGSFALDNLQKQIKRAKDKSSELEHVLRKAEVRQLNK